MKQKKLGVGEHQSLRIYPQTPSPEPAPATFISHKRMAPTSLHPLPSGGRGDPGSNFVRGREGGAAPELINRKTKKEVKKVPQYKLSQIITVIQTYQKPMKYKLNTNKINTMEDRRTQGNGRGAQRFRLFSFLLQTGHGHPGPRFGLSHIQGGQSKGPWCHFPPPPGPLVLRRGV